MAEAERPRDEMRAIVVVPVLRSNAEAGSVRTAEGRLEEAVGLAHAIELNVTAGEIVMVSQPRPATLIGTGKIEQIKDKLAEGNAGLVIVDHPLTPVQQRNLEKAWTAKVIDRTGLILEIFGRRASTKEGSLQVELAHLNYQKGRLVRSWTHLERQRGGAGFLGGPGETQIEADRRVLQDKIVKLERELEQVRRTRQLHRAKRKKVPHPIVALAGYTNAGKSTLFNRLTGAGVVAEDMLFATLDPTLRRIKLPHGRMIILSDTVGFISDLPTHLVAAFRATLEEVLEADLILHIRDMSDPDNTAQAADVLRILGELGIDEGDRGRRIVDVWNKIDRLEPEAREALLAKAEASPDTVAVSAVSGQGVPRLLALVGERLSGVMTEATVVLQIDQLSLLPWFYEHTIIDTREDREDGSVSLDIRLSEAESIEMERRLGLGDPGLKLPWED